MSFKDAFQSQEAETGFAPIDEGTYEAEISDAQLDMTKEPNRVTIEYTITGEAFNGRKLWSNYNLEGRGIGFLKKDMQTLGLDYSNIDSPESILDLLSEALEYPVVIYVKQNQGNDGKTYCNAYLNERLDAPAATAPNPAPTNQKEADRRAAKAPAQKAPPTKGKPATQSKSQDPW